MNIAISLNEQLLNQVFVKNEQKPLALLHFQYTAFMYAQIENSVAVLSDMSTNKSYVYNGGVASKLALSALDSLTEIDSIWEDEIFSRIHPDDLVDKHLLELQFFNMIKSTPISLRANFHVNSRIRMLDENNQYIYIKHRMFYISSLANGSLWLALCLYNFVDEDIALLKPDRLIVNSATGEIIKPDDQNSSNLLSSREKEILTLIRKGKMSKEIAFALGISINTVNRHRQNILEKLMVNNSHEACRIAELLDLI
ncbi:MAG: response regulator transcription factor [Pedobacter sp.]|nr:MAG: response regulator transcription factor [Pedobacter sp.]